MRIMNSLGTTAGREELLPALAFGMRLIEATTPHLAPQAAGMAAALAAPDALRGHPGLARFREADQLIAQAFCEAPSLTDLLGPGFKGMPTAALAFQLGADFLNVTREIRFTLQDLHFYYAALCVSRVDREFKLLSGGRDSLLSSVCFHLTFDLNFKKKGVDNLRRALLRDEAVRVPLGEAWEKSIRRMTPLFKTHEHGVPTYYPLRDGSLHVVNDYIVHYAEGDAEDQKAVTVLLSSAPNLLQVIAYLGNEYADQKMTPAVCALWQLIEQRVVTLMDQNAVINFEARQGGVLPFRSIIASYARQSGVLGGIVSRWFERMRDKTAEFSLGDATLVFSAPFFRERLMEKDVAVTQRVMDEVVDVIKNRRSIHHLHSLLGHMDLDILGFRHSQDLENLFTLADYAYREDSAKELVDFVNAARAQVARLRPAQLLPFMPERKGWVRSAVRFGNKRVRAKLRQMAGDSPMHLPLFVELFGELEDSERIFRRLRLPWLAQKSMRLHTPAVVQAVLLYANAVGLRDPKQKDLRNFLNGQVDYSQFDIFSAPFPSRRERVLRFAEINEATRAEVKRRFWLDDHIAWQLVANLKENDAALARELLDDVNWKKFAASMTFERMLTMARALRYFYKEVGTVIERLPRDMGMQWALEGRVQNRDELKQTIMPLLAKLNADLFSRVVALYPDLRPSR